jgi:uncharacterized membrane protein YkoI
MKKSISLLMISAVIAAGACAQQRIDPVKVPPAVKQSFATHFAGVTPSKWENEHGKYEAEFKQDGHEMSALFDGDGTMTESEVEIKVSELPAEVKDYVKKNYPNATIKEAAKITKPNGEVNYEAEVKGKDLLFDSNGKPLKPAKA